MKTRFKVMLALLVLLALPTVVQSQFQFITNNGTITITRYTGPGGDVAIPDTTNGLPVTSIGTNAFLYCTSLTSVAIPGSVTNIGDLAFYSCTSLTNITLTNGVTSIGIQAFYGCNSLPNVAIPSSVTRIGSQAFSSCTSLTSMAIPSSVTSIGLYAFGGCTRLTAITVDTLNLFYTSLDGVLFNKSQAMLIQYPEARAGSDYTIPNSVTSIGIGAFYNCARLASVTIPSLVTNIGIQAFFSCTNLTNITIPSSVTIIGILAFDYCSSLTAITVDAGNSFYSSLDGVLFNKSRATLIQYPEVRPGSHYTIPDGVATVGDSAFEPCTKLSSVTIPNSVTSIGSDAFYGCTKLTNVTIGESVTRIGNLAFSSCTNLTSVTIPNNVTNIGSGAFESCTSLTNITIGNGVIAIGGGAFSYCSSLSAITVDVLNTFYSSVDGVLFNKSQTTLIQYPQCKAGAYTIANSITNIGYQAFWDCTRLTSVSIPNSVINIGGWAFAWCSSLNSLTLGNGLSSIGDAAFSGCSSLTSVTLGNSVSSIGDNAFSYCSSLNGVFFRGNAPTVALGGGFNGDIKATIYYFPGTTGWSNPWQGRPTALWFLPNPLILNNSPSFGLQTNGFGFIISWATNASVVIEACTNLGSAAWSPVATNTLTSGSSYFRDPQSTNYTRRFYRLRSL